MASTFFAMSLQPVIDAGLSGGSVRFCPRLCLGGCAGPCGCAGRLSGRCADHPALCRMEQADHCQGDPERDEVESRGAVLRAA